MAPYKRVWIAVGAAVALLAALYLIWPASAYAADKSLGGNCCADLEERIAELEATVGRKGNRKVSLTVSGWVAEQVTWWDDGVEQNVYVRGLGQTLASHVKFTGEAAINAVWSAGYVLHLEANTEDSLASNQESDDTGDLGVIVRQSFWFVKNKELGKVSVGRQSSASDNAALLVDGSGSMVPANWVLFDNAGFFLRENGALVDNGFFGLATWGKDLGYCIHRASPTGGDCNGAPLDSVRYDSPVFAGFSVSAAWGEDDFWDAALRYAGEFGGFKVSAVGAWAHNGEARDVGFDLTEIDATYYQGALYIEHIATGLFVYGAYGKEEAEFGAPHANWSAPDGRHWYAKAGMRERWMAIGHTVLYGEYARYEDQFGPALNFEVNTGHDVSSQITLYGLGVVQEIDQAAMSVWLKYRRYEGEATIDAEKIEFDALDMVTFGALINF